MSPPDPDVCSRLSPNLTSAPLPFAHRPRSGASPTCFRCSPSLLHVFAARRLSSMSLQPAAYPQPYTALRVSAGAPACSCPIPRQPRLCRLSCSRRISTTLCLPPRLSLVFASPPPVAVSLPLAACSRPPRSAPSKQPFARPPPFEVATPHSASHRHSSALLPPAACSPARHISAALRASATSRPAPASSHPAAVRRISVAFACSRVFRRRFQILLFQLLGWALHHLLRDSPLFCKTKFASLSFTFP
jgi:hypothetical protein